MSILVLGCSQTKTSSRRLFISSSRNTQPSPYRLSGICLFSEADIVVLGFHVHAENEIGEIFFFIYCPCLFCCDPSISSQLARMEDLELLV
jgi:hypothetical protein